MKKKIKIQPFKVFVHAFFIISMIVCILPCLLLISISFTSENAVINGGYAFIPKEFSLEAYKFLFQDVSALVKAYAITAFSAISGTFLALAIQGAAGYVLARKKFAYKKAVSKFLLISLLFSGGTIPAYIINTQVLHLNNNLLAYAIMGICGPYSIFVFRAFFQGLPEEVFESAEMDGATELQIFTRIILPMSTPIFATTGFGLLLGRWNDVSIPLYYMTKPDLYNLQYLLQQIMNEANYLKEVVAKMGIESTTTIPLETLKFAMCVIAAGPMTVAFPFFQKYFSKGMVLGSVKG